MSDAETESAKRINGARKIFRRAAEMCAEHNVTPEEISIAAMYFAFDAAESFKGPGVVAIEWQRSACDVIERALMNGDKRSADGS